MAIVGVPGWIGSSAVNETGQRWMSQARTTIRLPAAGWMSEMASKSKRTHALYVGTYNNNKSLGFYKSQRINYGSISPNTFAGHEITIMDAAQVTSTSIRFMISGNMANRRVRITIGGLGTTDATGQFSQNSFVTVWTFYFANCYSWMLGRIGQTLDVILELL